MREEITNARCRRVLRYYEKESITFPRTPELALTDLRYIIWDNSYRL